MAFRNCKVYKDGSHYIAIRPMAGLSGPRYKRPPEELIEVAYEEVENSPSNDEETVQENERAEMIENTNKIGREHV